MDLYADLPLAKGAKASAALDADGKPKASLSSTNSVWANAPIMVPQAAKNKKTNQPAPLVTSSTSMLPTALAAGRGKSPTRSTNLMAFKPASVAKKPTTANQVVSKRQEEKQESFLPVGRGLGYVTPTEVKVTLVQHQHKQEEELDVDLGPAAGQFFQVTYRDEYNPARPNSYEAFCKERDDRRKMEKVKKELSRRQRKQEREGKLEREQLVKDLAEGRAPAMELPAPAGRGRGMTMPAWMRKKIEENASVAASQPESERDVDWNHQLGSSERIIPTVECQFEDAKEQRGGLGYADRGMKHSGFPGLSSLSSPELSKKRLTEPNVRSRGKSLNDDNCNVKDKVGHSNEPELDEFGREIRHESKKKLEEDRDKRRSKREINSSFHGNQCTSSETYHEKRRRVSGWDKRSPKQRLTSRVVLLQNMVGPGEVDAELQDEVKGECSETYGPVTKCVIYEVTGKVSAEEAVRIFVQFSNAEDATKALTGLNGRFFGGRKVKAEYYDEGKFERFDLTN